MNQPDSPKPRRIAVILFNLGGPDSREAIEPFLFNFFMDRNIIRLPRPFRFLLAKLISKRRSRREAGVSYGEIGSRSPLLENSRAQAEALETCLNSRSPQDTVYECRVSMRYWHPMAEAVAADVQSGDGDPDEIVLLPLYPQFSTTTTRSSLQEWAKAYAHNGMKAPHRAVCCYPWQDGFVQAATDLVAEKFEQALGKARAENLNPPRLLFSAHGLPENIIKDGDPYQWQCTETAKAVAMAVQNRLDLGVLDWSECYQSRVGPQKWIGPSTEEALEHAARDQVPVVLFPHAFVNEHVETLVELDVEYRELSEKLGVPFYERVATVGTHEAFIDGLAAMVENARPGRLSADTGGRICPKAFRCCCMADSDLAGKLGLKGDVEGDGA